MIRVGWLIWTLASRVFCDMCMPTKIEGKIVKDND